MPSRVHSVKPISATSSGSHPVHVALAHPAAGERRVVLLDALHPGVQIAQRRAVEAGADLAGVDEVGAVVVADQQRAERDAAALRRGETADDEFLVADALELEPVAGAAAAVRRIGPLGDDTLVAALAGLAELLLARGVAVRR